MTQVLPFAVFLLMISIGMSLNLREMLRISRGVSAAVWGRLLLATFVIPPALVLVLARILTLRGPELIGLFLVAIAPGAPLLTRNVAKHGFNPQLAASYQVWGALLTPIMIPLVIVLAGKAYSQTIWIPPIMLLRVIAQKQFLPLLVGMTLMRLFPIFSRKAQPLINAVGNAVLVVFVVVLLVKIGPALRNTPLSAAIVAMLLVVGTIAAIQLVGLHDPLARQTLALSNANRHVGLALLLAGQLLHTQSALPAVACYAVAAPVGMALYVRLFARKHSQIATSLDTQRERK